MQLGNPVWTLKLIRERSPRYKITASEDVYDVCKQLIFPRLIASNVERFFFVGLNNSNEVVIIDEHSTGGVNESRVYIAEITKKLLLTNSNQVILIHNHPSGNLRPSSADEMITVKLREALNYFEIRVLDHLIVSDNAGNFLSFKEEGLIA
jgi:DNA repair protein RadC